jgi:hypothetical protein
MIGDVSDECTAPAALNLFVAAFLLSGWALWHWGSFVATSDPLRPATY